MAYITRKLVKDKSVGSIREEIHMMGPYVFGPLRSLQKLITGLDEQLWERKWWSGQVGLGDRKNAVMYSTYAIFSVFV